MLLVFLPAAVVAQPLPVVLEGQEGEVTSAPICTFLVNRSNQTIMGVVYTAPQTVPSGQTLRRSQNFRLESHEKKQICATGPFYEGRRLELVIRTLIPLFTCRTTLDREIFLDAEEGEGGIKKLSAACN